MNFRIFKTYQQLSDKPLLCGAYPEHGPLYVRLNKSDEVELWCWQCDYVLRPGLALYKTIVQVVDSLQRKK